MHCSYHLLQLSVHLLYLLLHAADFRLTRLDLAFQLLDLEIEHKLKFLQLAASVKRGGLSTQIL